MATERPRFSITVSDEMYEKINQYHHDRRFSTQTKAIASLIQYGLEAVQERLADTTTESKAPVEYGSNTETDFNQFEQFLEELGFHTQVEGDHYRLYEGNQSVSITADELNILERSSQATVSALAQELMKRKERDTEQ